MDAYSGGRPPFPNRKDPQGNVASPVLNEHATETQLARILESRLPPLRCVGEDWFVYRKGVWSKTWRDEFKPLALSIQDERTRTARKAIEVLKHVEFASQVSGKESDRSICKIKAVKSF